VEKGKAGGGLCYGYRVMKKLDSEGEPIRGDREIVPEEATIVRQAIKARPAVGHHCESPVPIFYHLRFGAKGEKGLAQHARNLGAAAIGLAEPDRMRPAV
jgi:hypothetical protein